MKWVYPDYYPLFKCIADQCGHNCCIGWEVDIDYSSMRKYILMKGELGEKLRRNIEGTVLNGRFVIREDGRCPFLNRQNLCELILEKSEKSLCQICRDHPRFRLRLTDREEIGLGLCCEAACRLILDCKEPVGLILEDNGRSKAVLSDREQGWIRQREALLQIAQDRRMPILKRMELIMERDGDIALPDLPFRQWVEALLQMERMDGQWTVLLEKRKKSRVFAGIDDVKQEQLLVYFLYRYYLNAHKNGDFCFGVTAFCVLSTQLIVLLCETPEDIYEVARLYSAEIEYSDVNAETLLSALHDYNS